MKKGFTLVELLAVIVLMSLVMMLIFPSVRKIYSSNTNKQYETYKDMMIKYAKTIPISNYKIENDEKYVCLSDLGMPKINEKLTCNGYVNISQMKAYLTCSNGSNNVFQDSGISLPGGCSNV